MTGVGGSDDQAAVLRTSRVLDVNLADPESVRVALQMLFDSASRVAVLEETLGALCLVLSALVDSQQPLSRGDLIAALEVVAKAAPNVGVAARLAQALQSFGVTGANPRVAPTDLAIVATPPAGLRP